MKKFFVIASIVTLLLTGCGTLYSSRVVEGEATATTPYHRAPISESRVILYHDFDEQPLHYETVGDIRVENTYTLGMGALFGMSHSQEAIDAKLKQEAASLGANAVIKIHQDKNFTTGQAVFRSSR